MFLLRVKLTKKDHCHSELVEEHCHTEHVEVLGVPFFEYKKSRAFPYNLFLLITIKKGFSVQSLTRSNTKPKAKTVTLIYIGNIGMRKLNGLIDKSYLAEKVNPKH